MELKDLIKQHGTPISFYKHEHVLHQGDQSNDIFYVESGLLKAYYLSDDGKENIKSFIKPGNIIGSLNAAYSGFACSFSLQALETVEVIQYPFNELLDAAYESHTIAKQLIDTLLTISMKKEQREYELLMLPAEERYLKFNMNEPELSSRLTQNDIARYLGVTPVALSRIKKRLA
ncbi:Crp/Fnr family transcriptional regulator [Thalassotalea fusca]